MLGADDACGRGPPALPGRLAAVDRCLVMGVVNVTPDSFSDGGAGLDAEAAVAHGLALAADGADLVDVGGESTRPGAARIERRGGAAPGAARRRGARRRRASLVSIDTMRAEVADAALARRRRARQRRQRRAGRPRHGRSSSPTRGCRSSPCTGAARSDRDGGARGLRRRRRRRARRARARGSTPSSPPASTPDRIVLDPGFGFAKRAEHGWALLARLDELVALGHPLLVGTSRKRFLGPLAAPTAPPDRERGRRDRGDVRARRRGRAPGRCGCTTARASADAVRVVAAVAAARPPSPAAVP